MVSAMAGGRKAKIKRVKPSVVTETDRIILRYDVLVERYQALENRDALSLEMLLSWSQLPAAMNKSFLADVKMHISHRFRSGFQGLYVLDIDSIDEDRKMSDNPKKRRDFLCNIRMAVLKVFIYPLTPCYLYDRTLLMRDLQGQSDNARDVGLIKLHAFCGSRTNDIPSISVSRLIIHCNQLHAPVAEICLWHVVVAAINLENIFDTLMSLPSLALAFESVAASGCFHDLSEFIDYIIGWKVLPWNTDYCDWRHSVNTIFNEDYELDKYFRSLVRSAILMAAVFLDFLESLRDHLDTGLGGLSACYTDIGEIFRLMAHPQDGSNMVWPVSLAENLCIRTRRFVSKARFENERSFLERMDTCVPPPPGPAPCRCGCDETSPSKRCLHYMWWFWDTVLAKLVAIYADVSATRRVLSDVLELDVPCLPPKDPNVYCFLESLQYFSSHATFTCSRFLLASVQGIEKLASLCSFLRARLSMDDTVQELKVLSILRLGGRQSEMSEGRQPPAKIALAARLLHLAMLKEADKDLGAIRKLQRLAAFERVIIGDCLKRKVWVSPGDAGHLEPAMSQDPAGSTSSSQPYPYLVQVES